MLSRRCKGRQTQQGKNFQSVESPSAVFLDHSLYRSTPSTIPIPVSDRRARHAMQGEPQHAAQAVWEKPADAFRMPAEFAVVGAGVDRDSASCAPSTADAATAADAPVDSAPDRPTRSIRPR